MSRSRRSKKKSENSMIWFLLIIVIILIALIFLVNKNEIEDENDVNNDFENTQIINEEIESDEVIEEVVENNISNEDNEKTEKEENAVMNPPVASKPAVTDQKQKAIELVKAEWGEDDTVSYVFDYINEKGEYVIAVKDKASATVKNYFRVNLETEIVELD